jgi:uncharacterized protein YxeA
MIRPAYADKGDLHIGLPGEIHPSFGEKITVTVAINMSESALGEFNVTLNYSPQILTPIDIDDCGVSEIGSPFFEIRDLGNGCIQLSSFNPINASMPTGIISVARITFTVKSPTFSVRSASDYGQFTPFHLIVNRLADTNQVDIYPTREFCCMIEPSIPPVGGYTVSIGVLWQVPALVAYVGLVMCLGLVLLPIMRRRRVLVSIALLAIVVTSIPIMGSGYYVRGENAARQGAQYVVIEQRKSWDDVKRGWDQKFQEIKPTLDKIEGMKKDFANKWDPILKGKKWDDLTDEQKGNYRAEKSKIFSEASRVTARLQGYLQTELKDLLSQNPDLQKYVANLEKVILNFNPYLLSYGTSDAARKTINLSPGAVIQDAEQIFGTLFHESVHQWHSGQPGGSDFPAKELFAHDKEREFLKLIGSSIKTSRESEEWNYALERLESEGYIRKGSEGRYEATAKGKKIAQQYLDLLKQSGWIWEWEEPNYKGKKPTQGGQDALGVINYFQEKWRKDGTEYTTPWGDKGKIIVDTNKASFGKVDLSKIKE